MTKEELHEHLRAEYTRDNWKKIVNLHRSNLIVNYDIPWNATRLMQRIGRVNRIGTLS